MTDKNNQENFDAQLLAQMMEDFHEESRELLDQLNLNLTRLEDNPEDEELINEIFRNAHTLKGTASFIGLDKIKEVAHKMEDVFGAIRKKALKVNASLIDVMFEALEVLTLLKDKSRTKDPADVDISWVINNLLGILGGTLPESEERIPENETVPEKPGQIPISKSKIQNQAAEAAAVRKTASTSETIRVPTERLDNFMNLVGEMITSQNRLSNFSDKFKNAELTAIASAIARLTSQIHTGLMSVRMVPIEKLFNKFPGVVRNLARERNKELELIINGKDTELDKTVIEQIYDPLVHLLRNAIDHGIESSEKRQEQGKSPVGQIGLSAWHSQNNVIIEVADDGQGIDPARMKQVAIQKGIITEEKALAMTDDQAIRLIFLPGFSSAEKVTDISGRGVGMDVVKENVQKLRGMVDVRTKVGRGTTFQIQMPLTLAILQVLLVKANGLTYALPLNMVSETILLDSSEIKTMEKNEAIFIRGRPHPLKKLSTVMKCGSAPGSQNGKVPVIVVGLAEKRVALSVDELLGKQEVVMKSIGEFVGRVEGIEGATILADGSVTLIMDVEAALKKE